MSLLTKVPIQNIMKRRRIPNAFMLFVKENKSKLMQKYPGENLTIIGTLLGKKWKSLGSEEKQVYYDQYKVLKEKYTDASGNVMDNDLIREIDAITKDMPKLTKSDDAYLVHEDASDTTKHHARDLKSSEGECVASDDSKVIKKTTRRGKNPFLIFAREQSKNVRSTPKNHKSTILGHMWQCLDYSEKMKYVEMAKIESLEDARANPGPSTSFSKTKKRKSKKIVKKLLTCQPRGGTERTLSKKNEARSSIGKTVDAVASGSSNMVPEDPSVSNASDPTPRRHASQSCPSTSSTSCLPTSSSCFANPSYSQCPTHSGASLESVSTFRLPSSTAYHPREQSYHAHGSSSNNFSQPLCLHSVSDSLAPNQPYFGGPFRPYFSGMPGFFPPDPLSYFWVYQQSVSPYYPSTPFYQPCCPCNNAYGTYPGGHSRSFIYGSNYPSMSFGQPGQFVPTDGVLAPNVNRQCFSDQGASDNESNHLVIVDDVQEGNEELRISEEPDPRE